MEYIEEYDYNKEDDYEEGEEYYEDDEDPYYYDYYDGVDGFDDPNYVVIQGKNTKSSSACKDKAQKSETTNLPTKTSNVTATSVVTPNLVSEEKVSSSAKATEIPEIKKTVQPSLTFQEFLKIKEEKQKDLIKKLEEQAAKEKEDIDDINEIRYEKPNAFFKKYRNRYLINIILSFLPNSDIVKLFKTNKLFDTYVKENLMSYLLEKLNSKLADLFLNTSLKVLLNEDMKMIREQLFLEKEFKDKELQLAKVLLGRLLNDYKLESETSLSFCHQEKNKEKEEVSLEEPDVRGLSKQEQKKLLKQYKNKVAALKKKMKEEEAKGKKPQNTAENKVYIYNKEALKDYGFEILSFALSFNKSLTTLNISGNNITSKSLKYIHLFLPKLNAFAMDRVKLDSSSIYNISKCLPYCPNLVKLSLAGVILDSEKTKTLSTYLGNLRTLEYLNLSDNYIDDKQLTTLRKALCQLKSLKTIFLRNNKIKTIQPEFNNIFNEVPNLTNLLLGGNQLQDSSIELLAIGVKSSTTLKTLEVEDSSSENVYIGRGKKQRVIPSKLVSLFTDLGFKYEPSFSFTK